MSELNDYTLDTYAIHEVIDFDVHAKAVSATSRDFEYADLFES